MDKGRARAILDSHIAEEYSKLQQENRGESEDSGNPIVSAAGKALGVLDIGNRAVTRPAMGWLAQQSAEHGLHRGNWSDEKVEAILEADSKTDAYEAKMAEHSGWSRFAVEALGDPLNLIGLGLVGKLNKAGNAADANRLLGLVKKPGIKQAVDRAEIIDEAIARGLALPITLPIRGLGKGYRAIDDRYLAKTGKRLGETIPRYQVLKRVQNLTTALGRNNELEPEMVGRVASDPGEFRRVQDLESLTTRYNQIPKAERLAQLRNEPDMELARAYKRTLETVDNSLLPDVQGALRERGLLQADGNLSHRLRAHTDLEETLRNQAGMTSPVERELFHETLDYMAEMIPQSQSWKGSIFRSADDVYQHFNVRGLAGVGEDPATFFQTLDKTGMRMLNTNLHKYRDIDSIANVLSAEGYPPNLADWYAESAELIFHLGFDYSPAFNRQMINAMVEDPVMVRAMNDLNMSPEQVRTRLEETTKLEAFTSYLGGGSQNEGPTRNLFHALRMYRNNTHQFPIRGQAAPGAQPGTPAMGDSIPAGTDLEDQALHAYRQMLDPEGAMSINYLRARNAGKVKPSEDPNLTPVHPWGDKMQQFSRTFKEEVDALAGGYRVFLSTGDRAAAQQYRQTAREAIKYYVSDRWDKNIWMDMVSRVNTKAVRDLVADISSGKEVSRSRIKNAYAKLLDKPETSRGAWLALKHRVHHDVFPTLTNRPRPDGSMPEIPHENWQQFREQFPNPSALQAELWYRAQVHDRVAFQIVAESMMDPNVARRMTDMPDDELAAFISRETQKIFSELPSELASRPDLSNPSLKFVANFEAGTPPSMTSPSSIDMYSNPAIAREVQGHLGRQFELPGGEPLPIPGTFEQAARGDIDPLYQRLGDDLIKGAFTKQAKGGIVRLGTKTDLSTAVHELLGHYFPEFAGDPDFIRLVRSVAPTDQRGQQLPWDRETKEAVATGIENFFRTQRPNDPRLATFFDDFQRMTQELPVPETSLHPRAQHMLVQRMRDDYVSPYGAEHPVSQAELRRAQTNPTTDEGVSPLGTLRPGATTDITELSADASIDQVTRRIQTELGLTEQQMQPVNKLLHEHAGPNTEYFRAANLIFGDREYGLLAAAAQNPQMAREYVADALYTAGNKAGAWGLKAPILNRILETLPTFGQPMRAQKATRAIGRTDLGIMTPEHMDEIRHAMSYDEVRRIQNEYESQTSFIDNIMRQIKDKNPTARFAADNDTTYRDIVDAMDWGTTEQRRMLEEYLNRWGITKAHRRTVHNKQLADAYHDALKKEFGIENVKESPWMKWFRTGQKGWREQALLSVRYHFANAMDMISKSAVYGVNPILPNASAFQFMKNIGFENVPDSIRSDFLRDATMKAEFQQPGGDVVLGSIPAVGRPLGWLVDKNRTLAMWMETSARSAAWRHGTKEHLTKSFKPLFMNQVRRWGKQHRIQDNVLNDVVDTLRRSDVEFDMERARKLVFDRTGNQAYADDVATLWGRGLREASQHGEDLALRVHFDFANEREWERLLSIRDILPFHVWATRNIPFYLQTMAQNPWMMRVMYTYHDVQSQEMMDMNLTPRFRERMMVPEAANPVISLFLGPGSHFYNPTVVFSIADQFKEPYIPDDPQGLERFGNILRQAQRAGFAPAPWIDLPLNAAGVYGAREPFGAWRHGDLVTSGLGTAGIDVDYRPTQRAVQGIRGALPWNENVETYTGSGFLDRAINLRLRELALEETGDPEHLEYVRATTDPDSELYKRAKRDVYKQRFREQVFGAFMHNIPHSRLPDYERERRAVGPSGSLEPEASAWLRQRGHPSTEFWGVPADKRRAQISSGFSQTRGMNREQREQVLAGQELPWFWDYLAWLTSRPEGADTSVDEFLRQEG